MGKTYSVLIIDNFHMDPEHDYKIGGFPTLELAKEFAGRYVRDSIESMRKPGQTAEELRKAWYQFGEAAVVLGGDYKASSELDFFIDNPATPEQRDWQAVKAQAGIE